MFTCGTIYVKTSVCSTRIDTLDRSATDWPKFSFLCGIFCQLVKLNSFLIFKRQTFILMTDLNWSNKSRNRIKPNDPKSEFNFTTKGHNTSLDSKSHLWRST